MTNSNDVPDPTPPSDGEGGGEGSGEGVTGTTGGSGY